MNQKYYIKAVALILAAGFGLSGCQLLSEPAATASPSVLEAGSGRIYPVKGEVNIACSGTYHCEISQVDNTLVINKDTHRPVSNDMVAPAVRKSADGKPIMVPALLNSNSVKVVPLFASNMKGLVNYYVRMMPAKREVHVNFYPENNVDYVERFAMIHEFNDAGTYQLKAYRKRGTQGSGSLLDNASPDPLCIDLLQNNQLKRRFCKQLDTEHQGEFVEADLTKKAVVKAKV
ncbi:hypothetical protein [Psychrobacter ciconiae]|uniref:hypothetical protein n=1 Tax=Psychrobacter ciconiae TaxID=1553449 RepID=UPI00191B7CB9|nr:hypothetical protein [Psychrobacter ciconiae]